MIQLRRDKRNPDQWNVFGPASEVKPGEVTVTKKDGTTQRRRVVSVSRAFDVDGVPHVYGYLEERAKAERREEPPAEDAAEQAAALDDYDRIPF